VAAERSGNLFEGIPQTVAEELFEVLIERAGFKLERIVSDGQTTPPGQWYDQEGDEWVVLLRGGAAVLFEDEPEPRQLRPGDYLFIPARRRHRVEWTDAATKTIWLALHCGASASSG